MNTKNKKIEKALLDKAVGYTTKEIVEEYGYNGEDFVLQKRKVSEKSYPPDMSAIQMLLDKDNTFCVESMSDEELNSEKQRLLKLLKENEKNEY